ncbi:MAG: xanthan lyase [Bacteroidales bacterium]|nr:xanthan lyase [Bacteroidales bacterium]
MHLTLRTLLVTALALTCTGLRSQNVTSSFKEAGDTVSARLMRRTTVHSPVVFDRVTRKGDVLDFCFSSALEDHPLSAKDTSWLRKEVKDNLPSGFSTCQVGRIYTKTQTLDKLVMPLLSNSGQAVSSRFRVPDPRGSDQPMVEKMGSRKFPRGMSGRYIALWQSHGRYFEANSGRWEWQRSPNFTTVEDMYTQSYVLPFLIPMLENAGAYVMTPRERDLQRHEVICDNDPAFGGPRTGMLRRKGRYNESGAWSDAGVGFADSKQAYSGWDNPFLMGTVRKAECSRVLETADVKWTADIPEDGEYAVYISYKTLPNSTESAHYVVNHAGGKTDFVVNQRMGGGTWIYLGTFPFRKDGESYVRLDNGTPAGRIFKSGTVVTADAVKFGGGMGKILRGEPSGDDSYGSGASTSGVPCFAEGALYWMQFAGIDSTLHEKWDREYTKEFALRGAWVGSLTGGSRVNPNAAGKNIPIDLSLGFHSDAGVTPSDSTVGTLSIYTLVADGSTTLPNGEDRWQCRELANYVQTQVVNDIRADFDSKWSRRMLWNRSYSEARTTTVPGMLLEILSHQNFADMKYGLDPAFRFEVSRAVYKGILKYLSNRYGCRYSVQPLPVRSFAVVPGDSSGVRLSWIPVKDDKEPTAAPSGYIVYTRIDDGPFDSGKEVDVTQEGGRVSCTMDLRPGHLYSFKVVAFNDGGRSFPSEILSAGIPDRNSYEQARRSGGRPGVVVVNNFDRVGPPAWFDTPNYAGFDERLDSGMPYLYDLTYIGEQYQFRRSLPWTDNDNPGFGGSFTDMAAHVFPGNTFDFPAVHGRTLMDCGYPFYSVSQDAFSSDTSIWRGSFAADIICGKQVTTMVGRGEAAPRHEVFPDAFQKALREYTSSGRGVLISGSNIATDLWDEVYPMALDSAKMRRGQKFVTETLGYKWLTNYSGRSGKVWVVHGGSFNPKGIKKPLEFYHSRNEENYWVETPDGILPASPSAQTFLRYTDSNVSAGVAYDGENYRVISMAVPLEVFMSEKDRKALISVGISWLAEKPEKSAARPRR